MSTHKDYRDMSEEPKRHRMVPLLQGIALGGIVMAIGIPFFFTDKIYIDPNGDCVKKIEVKFSEDIEHPCRWNLKGKFETVHVDFQE